MSVRERERERKKERERESQSERKEEVTPARTGDQSSAIASFAGLCMKVRQAKKGGDLHGSSSGSVFVNSIKDIYREVMLLPWVMGMS